MYTVLLFVYTNTTHILPLPLWCSMSKDLIPLVFVHNFPPSDIPLHDEYGPIYRWKWKQCEVSEAGGYYVHNLRYQKLI